MGDPTLSKPKMPGNPPEGPTGNSDWLSGSGVAKIGNAIATGPAKVANKVDSLRKKVGKKLNKKLF